MTMPYNIWPHVDWRRYWLIINVNILPLARAQCRRRANRLLRRIASANKISSILSCMRDGLTKIRAIFSLFAGLRR